MSIYLPSSLVWLRNSNFQLFVLFDNTIQVLFEKAQCLWNKDTEFFFTSLLFCNNNEFQRNTAPIWRNVCNSSFPSVFFIVYNEANTILWLNPPKTFALCYDGLQWFNPRGQRTNCTTWLLLPPVAKSTRIKKIKIYFNPEVLTLAFSNS